MSAGLQRERKVITVLFCDLVGFTARAESLDPEDVASLLDSYHERLKAELEHFGGTVEKFIGDAVMAVFGAPVAHEDDPERAVRAALAIRDWAGAGDDLEVRIGITMGEALVRRDAAPGEAIASGDVVNTAARLQAAAPTDGILVDDATYRATERAIDYLEAKPVEAKGKARPVPVWQAQQARARFGVDVATEARTELVGRQNELASLVGALDRARRQQTPQLVTLVGVPGIGKSRLVHELFAAVEEDPELLAWRQGRSLPYGEGMAFWALAEMVKAQAGMLETDSAEQTEEKLRSTVAAVLSDPAEARWVAGHLRPLVGLASEAELGGDRQAEAFAAWRRFLEALAEQRVLVLVFEDLHWADEGLLDFVDHLVDWASGVPLLVVCTARPELLSRRPGWGGGKPNATTTSLSALSEDETARLVHALLDRSVMPAGLQATLLERAGGNPLYAEEFVRMVRERGSLANGQLPVPESLQGVIAARLDALMAEEKRLLQDAAVIGKVFWPGALSSLGSEQRTVVECLHALERKQFVRRERRSSVAEEIQYAFLHLLVRDVAYGQIPRAQRVEKHRLAAEWIESLAADRSEDRAEMLAHHYLAALEFAGTAGIDTAALAGPARRALREAGDRAAALSAAGPAIRFYGVALELMPDDDPERPYALFAWARARSLVYDHDIGALEEAIAGLVALGDAETAAEAEAFLAIGFWSRGQRDPADEHLARAVSLVAGVPPSAAKVAVLAERPRFLMWSGESEAAVRTGREVLAMAEQLGLDAAQAGLLNNIGTARVTLDDEAGLADLEESLSIGLALGLADHIHRSFHNLMECYRRLGRLEKSAEILAQERMSDERFGLVRLLRWVVGEEATDRYLRGKWDEALARAEELIEEAEAGASHYQESPCLVVRAFVRLARGDDFGADEDSTRALELAREQRDVQAVVPALCARARLLLAIGRAEEAAQLVDEALTLPAYYSGLVDLAWSLVELGRAEALLERRDQVQRTPWGVAALAIAAGRFDEAADVLADIGAVSDEAYARLRSGQEGPVRQALEFYRSVGGTRYIREGEALLAATA